MVTSHFSIARRVSTNVHEENFCTTPGDVRYLDSEVTAQKIFSGALLTDNWKFIKNVLNSKLGVTFLN